MRSCSVCKEMEIDTGRLEDYKKLAHYHYRDSPEAGLGPFAAIYAIRPNARIKWRADTDTVGVIVYTMPNPHVELRNVATAGVFAGLDRDTQLALVNKNIRRIARVIIEPRFRGIGLAAWLVRATMPLMKVPFVEALAVMGLVNPFFEKGGMQAYTAKTPLRNARLIEALSSVGIEGRCLINPRKVQDRIAQLDKNSGQLIEREITLFLQSYGKRRSMSAGLNRARYVLTKLTDRPTYYIWFNPDMELRI